MAVTTRAHHFTNSGLTAAEARAGIGRLWGERAGVIRFTDTSLQVTEKSGTTDMSVDVAEGACIIKGTESSTQGFYIGDNPETTNVAITAADGSNARKDLIVARIKDQDFTSGSPSTNTFTVEVVTGTAAASPAVPTVPDNCVVLALVDVPASDTSIEDAQITDYRWNGQSVNSNQDNGSACPIGGTSVGLSTARPQSPHIGLMFTETDKGDRKVEYDGSAWVGVGAGLLTTFTPSNTNITTSTNNGWYVRQGDMVTVRYQLILSAAPSGNIQIGLPVAVTTAGFLPSSDWGRFHGRIGTTNYEGFVQIEAGGTQFTIFEVDYNGATDQRWNATNPGAWASAHTLNGTFTYFV